jgi:hypothetical protein
LTAALTHKVIPYSGELDDILELWMSQDLPRHGILPRVLDDALLLALLVLFNLDDAGRKALLELFLVFRRDGLMNDDVGQEAI